MQTTTTTTTTHPQNHPATPTIQDSLRIATRIGGMFVFATIAVTVALLVAVDGSPDLAAVPLVAFVFGILVSLVAYNQAVTNERNQAHRRQNALTDADLAQRESNIRLTEEQQLAQIRLAEAQALSQLRIHEAQVLGQLPAPRQAKSSSEMLVGSPVNPKSMVLKPAWSYVLTDGRVVRGELIEVIHELRAQPGDKRKMIRQQGISFGNNDFTAAHDAWVEVGGMSKELKEGSEQATYTWIEPRYQTISMLMMMRDGNLTPTSDPAPLQVQEHTDD